MNIQENVDLANYSTMRLGGKTRFLIAVTSQDEVLEALNWANSRGLKILMIGGGSNIIWQDSGFDGVLLVNQIKGFEVLADDLSSTTIKIGAGENWDSVVGRTVNQNLSGIECLSLIPGTTGATPIQNVGAYGQEISSSLISLEAIEVASLDKVSLVSEQLGFSYRTSSLKLNPGKYLITSITLKLSKEQLKPPFYASLQLYLNQHNITNCSPASLRDAVIAIRTAKLPDPAVVANCGSFFANPIISKPQLDELEARLNTQIPHWQVANGEQKVAAAWLIENIGYKDVHDNVTGIGTWKSQPLVLVNESAKSTSDLFKFRDDIIAEVRQKFNIELEQEPQILPN
ncbi:MAG TPA: UDP-N-acetylmuramate dehydrogenase [Candidatus Saccharimonadales bacterium]